MAWSGDHCPFIVEEFVKIGESVVTTQHSFRRPFALRRHNPVPDGKSIRRTGPTGDQRSHKTAEKKTHVNEDDEYTYELHHWLRNECNEIPCEAIEITSKSDQSGSLERLRICYGEGK
ncbi:Hypothetical predicted protein [Octopus vulgaris]|uniref:DUF4817 domain-containing protein n=1 Tax=Octopus vulgaris TaxID=6645 RepID=A0AA36AVB2_OCTVU|nr:Hypothetical predicted protein [Octopus vulgaris]